MDQELAEYKALGFALWREAVDKATISLSYLDRGWPVSRSLILRGFDPKGLSLQLNTDKRSQKVAALAQNPQVCVLLWDREKNLQSQLWGRASGVPGVSGHWRTMANPIMVGML